MIGMPGEIPDSGEMLQLRFHLTLSQGAKEVISRDLSIPPLGSEKTPRRYLHENSIFV